MTFKHVTLPILAGCALALSAGAGLGQDATGAREFTTYCSACHGEMGKGGGEVARYLTVEVPDLTQLSVGNDGTFPMLDVIHVIDGRTGVRGHATQMPVWGTMFTQSIGTDAGAFGGEQLVRGRILSLAYYLESIQE